MTTQAMDDQKPRRRATRSVSRARRLAPPLAAALICTVVIARAIIAVVGGKANGDLMVTVCPLLGAVFLSIPAAQAWWVCFKIVRGK
jgi:hypothetical protein